jgi:vacuolar iron transporter family protein
MDTQTRLHTPDTEKHPESSDRLTDIVIGMSDGLTIPFALAAGLSSTVHSSGIIIIAGMAVVAAGSMAMALGGYLAGRSELAAYNRQLKGQYAEAETTRYQDVEETKQFFANIGLSKELQQKATEEISQDKDRWAALMMKYEWASGRPNLQRARKSALYIGLSYIAGGLVPLSPYFFMSSPTEALKISVIITLASLFLFGFFKSRITGVHPWWGALRVTFIGALAAACAFGVARLVEG